MEIHPGEGVKKKSLHSRKPSHRHACGEFWNLSGQHNWKEKRKNSQNMQLIAAVAQMPLFSTSKWGLGRKAQAASSVLRVRTGPECPEDNMRELL